MRFINFLYDFYQPTGWVLVLGVAEGQLTIFDNIGKVVMKRFFNQSSIDISSLPSGVYFFQITTTNLVTTKRIIKR